MLSKFPLNTIVPAFKDGAWKLMVPALLAILILVGLGFYYHWDVKVVALVAVIFAIFTNVFAWLLALIAVVPVAGPLLIKLLALPIIWLLNAIGYLVSFVAIKRGYSQDVITYRGLTIALIIGIIIGFIIGNLT